ncbi:hypothetical protein HGA15_02195 [Nocardia flavorosea]|uniref:Uncharacterized protein n=1 Tax=Nocardia flavorosea TaxID=53429 RepID=A0A846Y611_9NOCA|nr:hypothetical protein [Nocardia flavorosea]
MNLAAASTRSRSVRIPTVATAGSVTNLQMLELGTIDAALVLGDAAVALGTRGSAIGRLYETYIHLAGRRDSRFRHIGDLRGARAISGLQARAVHSPPTASSGPRASQSAIDITMTHHKLSAAIRALRSGTVDVVV